MHLCFKGELKVTVFQFSDLHLEFVGHPPPELASELDIYLDTPLIDAKPQPISQTSLSHVTMGMCGNL